MTGSAAWKPLVGSPDSAGLVLAVDFDTTGRPEARFSDLATNLKTDFEVRETIPPAAKDGHTPSGTGYLDYWSRDIEAESGQVRALMGFCGGAVYAAGLAERIGRRQGGAPPLLLLFDPELSTAQTLIWQFQKVIGFLSPMISDEQIDEARRLGQRLYETVPEVGPLKDELIRLMREAGEPALVRAGLDKTRRDELAGVFDTFLGYLAAASQLDPREQWRSAVALSSTSPRSGLNAMRAAGLGEDQLSVAREFVFDVDHGSMLADHDVAATVSELLNA